MQQSDDMDQEGLSAEDRESKSRTFVRLSDSEQGAMLSAMPSEQAADLLRDLPPTLAISILESLPTAVAAAILNCIPSNEQTDLASGLTPSRAEEILAQMDPVEAADVQALRIYPAESAGGLMVREFLTAASHETAAEVVRRLQSNATEYAEYPVQYIYVTTATRQLAGVVQTRDLLFVEGTQPITAVMETPAAVATTASIDDLNRFFDRHAFLAAPVITSENELVGVVPRDVLEEAMAARAVQTFLRFSGIVAGEEFRTMSAFARSAGRLIWLGATLVLHLASASVIGAFEQTLSAVVALAAFLPVISGMSGNAGNQAIAVSMRELSLGLLQPRELSWVISKEAIVALMNGLIVGALLGSAAMLWTQNVYFGLVIGSAQGLMVLAAACLGGSLPLVLRRLGIDPALATAPLMTAVVDACGFFVTLTFAWLMLPWLI
jgi:magnesium transporter